MDVDDGRDGNERDMDDDYTSQDNRNPWRVDRIANRECSLLCRGEGDTGLGTPASEGVDKMVALDDSLVWTATGSSSVKQWHVAPARATRMKMSSSASWTGNSSITQLAAKQNVDGQSASSLPWYVIQPCRLLQPRPM